jgi:type IV pilus assembly protein PilW
MDGTPNASTLLKSIKAIRVGLIMRTSAPGKAADGSDTPTPASLTLFSDLPTPYVRPLSTDERQYRYRTLESTIPLRNSMLLN